MPYRHTLTFIAKPVREKRPYSEEDINTYEVKYNPSRGLIQGTSGACFSNLLLEAVCGLPEHNRTPHIVKVVMKGPFPPKYVEETKKVFDLYTRAERVGVEFSICDCSV